MKPFLQYVAEDLLRKYDHDLSRVVVVFPNKRAGLFLNEHLLTAADERPIWAPQYLTISELFRSFSPLKTADKIESVCHLYDIYKEKTGSDETLDFFYGWGEKLLADFDDVDKNMADAKSLFRNIADIKEIETHNFLSEEKERVLQDFFRDFSSESQSIIRQKFKQLWDKMYDIYCALNEQLAEKGMAYEGALYRSVSEAMERGALQLPADTQTYVFVGFNVLDKAEERLFSFLKKQGRALFYWDYDVFYAAKDTTFEAGTFLRKNLNDFPGVSLPKKCFDNLRHDKNFEFVSAPTESVQAKSIAPWLEEHLTTDDEKRTAIVLCNEAMLLPVIHSLPASVKNVNVTKGFPLSHTSAFALFERQSHKLLSAKQPPTPEVYLEKLEEEMRQAALQLRDEEWNEKDIFGKDLYTEAYFQTYRIINRFKLLVKGGSLNVTLPTLQRLLRQVVRQTSVPFHGEPAMGLQVMGVLETRCLDFENILMLSVNEGNLPQKASDNSFIPYSLRRAFGLTTSLHKTAVYAYYFYRLIQRAKHVRMVYNNASDGLIKGEMSRFMTQLLVETDIPVKHLNLGGEKKGGEPLPGDIPKPENLAERLTKISPSAINTYLRCQRRFYFQYVASLREPDPPADVIEPNTFGTIFHCAAQFLYEEKLTERDGRIEKDMLDKFLDNGGEALLLSYVRRAFEHNKVERNPVIEEVVKSYLRRLIEYDHSIAPFEVMKDGLEKSTLLPLDVPYADGTVRIMLKGNIDRLDKVSINGQETLRVIDYKTGGSPETPKHLDDLFTPGASHPHYALQTFLYSLTLLHSTTLPIAPALFFVHKAAAEDYSPYIDMGEKRLKNIVTVHNFRDYAEDFQKKLISLLAEILRPGTFTATSIPRYCETCPFANLCKK